MKYKPSNTAIPVEVSDHIFPNKLHTNQKHLFIADTH